MSRSRKKTPISGISTAASDKPYKVDEHRRARRSATAILTKSADSDHPRLHTKRFGDPWKSPKDGKQYWPATPREMRK